MTAACITARNEEETIGPLVNTLVGLGYEVFVVDDGSTDSTGDAVLPYGATVIRHRESQGIGPSLMEAWRAALALGCEAVIQLDAGGSHDPTVAPLIVAGLVATDVVIGSRFCWSSDYQGPRWRRWGSKLAAWLCSRACGMGAEFTDWTSGYRMFSRKAIETLLEYDYKATMHGWQMEVLWRAVESGLVVSEVPITYRVRQSSLSLKVVLEALRVGLRICVSRLRS